MKMNTADKGRILPVLFYHISIYCTIISGFLFKPLPVPGISLPVLATFVCGCHNHAFNEHMDALADDGHILLEYRSPDGESSHITVLTFDDDSLGRLDSFQYIDPNEEGVIRIASRGGQKRAHLYANIDLGEDVIAGIGTYADLRKLSCNLEELDQGSPFMSGMVAFDSDSKESLTVHMKKMFSEIVLQSVQCDFSGTDYAGERITDARAYLTNVNAQCRLSGPSPQIQRLVNVGRLNEGELKAFKDPGIIFKEIGSDIGTQPLHTDISFLCFQNISQEESPGTPFTKLVLEGKIQGQTYYWPIKINRDEGGEGIRSNTRHIFNLDIRRKGCLNPDDDIPKDDCEVISFASFPESYIRGDVADTLHLWCEFSPADAPFNVGLEELEEDRLNGIYDYIIDDNGHGVRLILKKPGVGLVYMEVGAPVNEAALWVIEVNLTDT